MPAFFSLILICQPRTGYCAKNNAQRVQNVFVPAIRTDAEILIRNLNRYKSQEAYGGGGYKRGSNDRDLFVIARYDIDNRTHKRSSGNSPCDKYYVCADNRHPIHIRRFPKSLDTFNPMDNAECHSNRMVRGEPQHDTRRNRDGPSNYINGRIIVHTLKRTSELLIDSLHRDNFYHIAGTNWERNQNYARCRVSHSAGLEIPRTKQGQLEWVQTLPSHNPAFPVSVGINSL